MTIVPLRIEDILPTGDFQYFLGNIHWLDELTPPLEKHLQQVVATVKAILGAEKISPPDRTPVSGWRNWLTRLHWPPRRRVVIGAITAVLIATLVVLLVSFFGPGVNDPGTKDLVSFWPLQGSTADSQHQNDGRLLGNAKFAQAGKSGRVLRLFGPGAGFGASTNKFPGRERGPDIVNVGAT